MTNTENINKRSNTLEKNISNLMFKGRGYERARNDFQYNRKSRERKDTVGAPSLPLVARSNGGGRMVPLIKRLLNHDSMRILAYLSRATSRRAHTANETAQSNHSQRPTSPEVIQVILQSSNRVTLGRSYRWWQCGENRLDASRRHERKT
jgi:hypothetical protein